jgi:hypothetical protein
VESVVTRYDNFWKVVCIGYEGMKENLFFLLCTWEDRLGKLKWVEDVLITYLFRGGAFLFW